jgi:hypothetical protein
MRPSCQTIEDRRKSIGELAAVEASELPVLPSGFWFHGDIRDNFYYAVHLFAYCVDHELGGQWSEEQRKKAEQLATDMIENVLSLQIKAPENEMYGHWPLNLGNDPSAAKPHPLPVELMGCLLMFFYNKYQNILPVGLKSSCSLAILHIYQSHAYREPLQRVNHHEAKHTSLKLLLGYQFDDRELTDQGLQFAKRQLRHIKQFGFKEYGALPWHWHWIQSFTCVWEVVEDSTVRDTMSELLDCLWQLRADYYLKGTWVGAQSRQWPHDAPRDNNTLLDYIQFGDFPMPNEITRLEGAALYTYQAADDVVQQAVSRIEPVEIKRKIQFAEADGIVTEEAHTYAYITPDYAVGGVWERRTEFDNEQQRWDITLPLTETNALSGGVNQAFFFHPGAKYVPGDDRHTSPYGEVIFHKDTVIQLWDVAAEEKEAYPSLIGCLPRGQWRFDNKSGYGRVEAAYLYFQLMNEFTSEEKKDRVSVTSDFVSGWNGVIMEAVSSSDAAKLGVVDLNSFAAVMKEKGTSGFTIVDSAEQNGHKLSAIYTTLRDDKMHVTLGSLGAYTRLLNGQQLNFDEYRVD